MQWPVRAADEGDIEPLNADRAVLAAAAAAPVALALVVFVAWPAPSIPAGHACGMPVATESWMHATGRLTSGLILVVALLLWARRLVGRRASGLRRLPWEAVLIIGGLALAWAGQVDDLLIVDLPPVAGLVALAVMLVSGWRLRRGDPGLLVAALWADALLLLPSLWVGGLFTDHVQIFCF